VIINRFTKLEGRVGGLEEKFVRFEEKFVKLEEKFVKLEEKFVKLEQKVDEVLFYLAPKFKRKKMKRFYRKT
jgi:predicted nuclease with TOPRIM domain